MTEQEKQEFGNKLSKLLDKKLSFSAHTILGWYGSFERVKRFYEMYIKEPDSNKKLDYALSFFIFSYHLRDWILNYEDIDKQEFDKQWNLFIQNYPVIKISRDICNVSKHLIITQESVDKNFALFWEYDPFVTKKSEWIIIYGDEREKLIELMRLVLNAWGDFIVNYLKLVIE